MNSDNWRASSEQHHDDEPDLIQSEDREEALDASVGELASRVKKSGTVMNIATAIRHLGGFPSGCKVITPPQIMGPFLQGQRMDHPPLFTLCETLGQEICFVLNDLHRRAEEGFTWNFNLEKHPHGWLRWLAFVSDQCLQRETLEMLKVPSPSAVTDAALLLVQQHAAGIDLQGVKEEALQSAFKLGIQGRFVHLPGDDQWFCLWRTLYTPEDAMAIAQRIKQAFLPVPGRAGTLLLFQGDMPSVFDRVFKAARVFVESDHPDGTDLASAFVNSTPALRQYYRTNRRCSFVAGSQSIGYSNREIGKAMMRLGLVTTDEWQNAYREVKEIQKKVKGAVCYCIAPKGEK